MNQAICWMLIHSLWQGLLFTILTGFVLVYTKKSSAAIRYNLLSGIFFLFLAGCVLTFIREWNDPGQEMTSLQGLAPFAANPFSSFAGSLSDYLSQHASLIVMGWCFVFLVKCVRMTAAIVYAQRVRNYGVTQPPVYWKDKTLAFCRTLQIKRNVLLLESRLVKMPLITGHWKPVIFIPLGLLTHLPEGEIEAVLLHELAHIRRNDYCMNFLQNVGENIFFFNPGLLWISSLLREERENCCDDIAIDRTRNKVAFVSALLHFKEYSGRLAGAVVPFPGNKHQLLQRVLRIAHNKNKSLNRAERIFLLTSFCIISLLLTAATHQMKRPADSVYATIRQFSQLAPSAGASSNDSQLSDTSGSSIGPALPNEPTQPDETTQSNDLAPSNESGQSDESAQPDESSRLNPPAQPAVPAASKEQDHAQPEQEGTGAADYAQAAEQDRAKAEEDLQQAADQARASSEQEREQTAEQTYAKAEHDRARAELERTQGDREREQAQRDRRQADEDRRQAQRDREQAILDKGQADKDREQAMLDRIQMQKDKETPSVQTRKTETIIMRIETRNSGAGRPISTTQIHAVQAETHTVQTETTAGKIGRIKS